MTKDKLGSDELVKLGAHFFSQGYIDKALENFQKAAETNPLNPDAYYNLGIAYQIAGKDEEAYKSFKKALHIEPDDFEVISNIGAIYLRNNELKKSEKHLKKALDINPNDTNTIVNLGVCLQYQKRFLDAKNSFQKALDIDPNNKSANNNMAVVLSGTGQLSEAVSYFNKVITLDPNFTKAYNNLGNVLFQLGRLEEARNYYQKSIELDKNYFEAHTNLAIVEEDLKNYKNAISNYKTALKLSPDNDIILSNLWHTYRSVCNWKDSEKIKPLLAKITKKKITNKEYVNEDPFINIMRTNNQSENLKVAKTHSNQISLNAESFYEDHKRKNERRVKINIGYVNNFDEAPIGYIIQDLFSKHDKRKFTIYCYHFSNNESLNKISRKIRRGCNKFVNISNLTHEKAADKISKDKIDILVDLKGYTKGHRMQIFALKPAPIQVTYLGFPGTTGASFFDWAIVDKTLVPPSSNKYYSEKLAYMPDCYMVGSKIQFPVKKYKKTDFGLPDKKIVFCSFNKPLKIDRKTFKIWMRILKKVPDSVLWLYSDNDIAAENLVKHTKKEGISKKRLIFAKAIPFKDHLSRLALADIALDTSIYSGGATTNHLLWAGIPVITLTGKHYLSRMSTSQLTAIGLQSTVTNNIKEYELKAIELATNPKKLLKLKTKIQNNQVTKLLFNTKFFVRNLEKIYKKMHDIYLTNKKAKYITPK